MVGRVTPTRADCWSPPTAAAATLSGPAVDTRTSETGQRTRHRHRGQPPASRHQQMEQDRAPALLLHQPELARPAACQLSGDCPADLRHHHQNRPHGALRTRYWPIPQRRCRLRRRDGHHQHQTRRIPRRLELHHLTQHLSAKLRVYFLTGPKGVAVNFLSYGFHGVPKGNGAFVYFEWDRLATRAIGTH